jgi:hypothetical protein
MDGFDVCSRHTIPLNNDLRHFVEIPGDAAVNSGGG